MRHHKFLKLPEHIQIAMHIRMQTPIRDNPTFLRLLIQQAMAQVLAPQLLEIILPVRPLRETHLGPTPRAVQGYFAQMRPAQSL